MPRHVICVQNHDQVGNRAFGERLAQLVPRGARKLAAALLLLAPETPLLFMGQEYDEVAPFQFFSDFGDPVLQKAVTEGRRREFKHFGTFSSEIPDPQDPQTFERSRLNWELASPQNEMLIWYRNLIACRRKLVRHAERTCRAELREGAIAMKVPAEDPRLWLIAAFPGAPPVEAPPKPWRKMLSSDEDGYRVAIFEKRRNGRAEKL